MVSNYLCFILLLKIYVLNRERKKEKGGGRGRERASERERECKINLFMVRPNFTSDMIFKPSTVVIKRLVTVVRLESSMSFESHHSD